MYRRYKSEIFSEDCMKYAIGIVIYYPNLEQLVENMKTYCSDNSVVIVFDNTDDELKARSQKTHLLLAFPNVLYVWGGRNTGIGHALNRIFEITKSKGLAQCLTMDQDSSFNNFEDYMHFAENNENKFSYLSPAYSGDASDIDRYFTSGSLVTVDSWAALEGFDERLFIDEVDGDFVFRLQRAGFKILKFQGCILTHELGESKCIAIFSRKICSANHSPIRKYYIARNRTYFFLRRKQMRWIYLSDSTLKLIQFVFVENDRWNKAKMIIRGIIDGLKGDLGEYRAR
jgi:rhamnosyltransferase